MTYNEALVLVRYLISIGVPREKAIANSEIRLDFREQISKDLISDENIILEPANILTVSKNRKIWLNQIDRNDWYYWPVLREHLIVKKKWDLNTVRSLDEITDQILGELQNPVTESFDIRGLVLGYVQSGKTSNFTALIAKAADVGYRLIVVLSGIDNGLRRQTQLRLRHELIGYDPPRENSVSFPPLGKQWFTFTNEDINGDFQKGNANHASLQGNQPVLLVVKKNGTVLRRLIRWFEEAPEEVRQSIPLLVIDDEADQASIDTRGSYRTEEEPIPVDYEPPSVINGLIRDLLRKFKRKVYVAYTATPFANILIPHDNFDPNNENDLYPKDFIVDLPKPSLYFGAEELFGRFDSDNDDAFGGLDVIRNISDSDLDSLNEGHLPASLETALLDYVLSGSARIQRGQGDKPATMLIHISQKISTHMDIAEQVRNKFNDLKDEWRYQRKHGIRDRFHQRWNEDYRRITQARNMDRDIGFEAIEPNIDSFLNSVQIKIVNSETGDVLDYDKEPALKAIAIGGNRLSRGLTLEGLLVSYYVRRTVMYDTLMQMGRWFGYRPGYDDLTRIYTTSELAGWFSDLAFVEHRLREDIKIYEEQGLTPIEVGMKIWQHPTMQVTGPLKRRFSRETTISQSYSFSLEQTFKFPLNKPDLLADLAIKNIEALNNLLHKLPQPDLELWIRYKKGPVWSNVHYDKILEFLRSYCTDEQIRGLSIPLITAYIERQVKQGELVQWTVSIRGRESENPILGKIDLDIKGPPIWQISRTRLQHTESLGVITSPGDESVGLSPEAAQRMKNIEISGVLPDGIINKGSRKSQKRISKNIIARSVRSPAEGLLLIYPISKYSGYTEDESRNTGSARSPLYLNPNDSNAHDLIGFAISFPQSTHPQSVEAYLEGTVGWRPIE